MDTNMDIEVPAEEVMITTMENLESKKNVNTNKAATGSLLALAIFLLIWAIVGVIAFIMSLVCFGYSGSTLEKVFGLVIAIFFGPFYWLYYYFNKGYCGKKESGKNRSRSRSRSRR
jgi:uncharacterized membrane protein